MVGDRPARRRFQATSVRVRTTVLSVVVVGLALLIGGVTLVVLLRGSLTDQVRTSAELRAADVVAALETGAPTTGLSVTDDEDMLIQVIDSSGQVVASSDNIGGEPALVDVSSGGSAEVNASPLGDEQRGFLFVADGAEAPSGDFTVLVGRSTELITDSTGLVTSVLLLGLPALLVLVGAVSWRVVGRALAPVDAMRREVDAISASELHRRVPATVADDEISSLAETMNRMLDRLQASRDRQRRFVSDASHELRSPVATIRQHAEVVIAHPETSTAAELAEVVLSEDLRVQRLVEDLLLLTRADERNIETNRRPVDVDDYVFEEGDRLRALGSLRVEVAGVSAGRVAGDPAQLRRVVRNLVDNAARHAVSMVVMSLRDEGGAVELVVEDDGGGIESAARERVFERFVRLDEARARDDGGSGLGLAIVSEIVAAHRGSVRVDESRLGGARFVVRLPSLEE